MTWGLKLADIFLSPAYFLSQFILMMNVARDATGVMAWSCHQRVMSRQISQGYQDADINPAAL